MRKQICKPGIRNGYDIWSSFYENTPNPLVSLDRRFTINILNPGMGELILDAGCGTGAHFKSILKAGSIPIGIDFSSGMLKNARNNYPGIPLIHADLNHNFPNRHGIFDAILCSLVSEHLLNLQVFYGETFNSLKNGGRFVLSAFHPERAIAGIEANFELNGKEYRLGAEKHTMSNYLYYFKDVGFKNIKYFEYKGDKKLIVEIKGSAKYLNKLMLLIIIGYKPFDP